MLSFLKKFFVTKSSVGTGFGLASIMDRVTVDPPTPKPVIEVGEIWELKYGTKINPWGTSPVIIENLKCGWVMFRKPNGYCEYNIIDDFVKDYEKAPTAEEGEI